MEERAQETKKEERPHEPKQRLVVGVQYRNAGKIYTFLTDDAGLVRGDCVVVEAEHGTSIGAVILPPQSVSDTDIPRDIRKVLRRAKPEELSELASLNEREMEIFELFADKVKEGNLPMKPLSAELRDGDKKVILSFFAEERVDFRSLVKDLAGALHMRIEMHQVGARDEVKCRGGIGSCGLHTCCSLHLRQFQSISIQMAKTQGLTPNPAKLTGICGKLKCCLAYENASYAEVRQKMPRVGMLVSTPQGDGKVTGLAILKEECIVRLDEGQEVRVNFHDVAPQGPKPAAEARGPEGPPQKKDERPGERREPEQRPGQRSGQRRESGQRQGPREERGPRRERGERREKRRGR